MKPSGNKDPFALRRAALGLARTLIESGAEVDLLALLQQAAVGCSHSGSADAEEIYGFVIERLRSHYADGGVETAVFDAVAALRPRVLADFEARIQAARRFAALPEAPALAAANKRIGNILKKLETPVRAGVDPALLEAPAEQALHQAWQVIQADIEGFAQQRNYTALLQALAPLREPIDAFFDAVMVMSDDERLRNNRLALLSGLRSAFLRVADISFL
jgi:glycyl-tRNA synthetase beta chain